MKGRLTLEKVNAAINDMATYAEANAHLISAPKKKVMIKLLTLQLLLLNLILVLINFTFLREAGRKSLGKGPGK